MSSSTSFRSLALSLQLNLVVGMMKCDLLTNKIRQERADIKKRCEEMTMTSVPDAAVSQPAHSDPLGAEMLSLKLKNSENMANLDLFLANIRKLISIRKRITDPEAHCNVESSVDEFAGLEVVKQTAVIDEPTVSLDDFELVTQSNVTDVSTIVKSVSSLQIVQIEQVTGSSDLDIVNAPVVERKDTVYKVSFSYKVEAELIARLRTPSLTDKDFECVERKLAQATKHLDAFKVKLDKVKAEFHAVQVDRTPARSSVQSMVKKLETAEKRSFTVITSALPQPIHPELLRSSIFTVDGEGNDDEDEGEALAYPAILHHFASEDVLFDALFHDCSLSTEAPTPKKRISKCPKYTAPSMGALRRRRRGQSVNKQQE